jgi:nucleoside-diphosphate-sugar epimerase
MRILVAGASGAIGRRLVPMLVERGHEVVGTTRTASKQALVSELGAVPLVLDALDPAQVRAGVIEAKPDVIVHQLTAIGDKPDLKHFDAYFADTNRLRTEGTDNLLAAARLAGVRRFVAQGYTGWTNPRTGGPVKTEQDGLDPNPTVHSRQTVNAMRHLEAAVLSAEPIEGVVLRYGNLYGPGNALGAGGALLTMVHKRQLPVVGGGGGIWSHIHVDDAARATVLATELDDVTGVYDIVDDDPAPVREWLPYLARVIGARPPLRLPAWLARPMIGEHGVSLMTQVRGSSNAKARAELGWTPQYPSWRQGFQHGLG